MSARRYTSVLPRWIVTAFGRNVSVFKSNCVRSLVVIAPVSEIGGSLALFTVASS